MAKGTTIILPSMHGRTFVWHASRELRIRDRQGEGPLVHVDSLLECLLFLVRHLWQDIGDSLRHLDVTTATPTVATAKSLTLDKSDRKTVETRSVLLSDFQNGLSFLRVHLHFLRRELVNERFDGEMN